MMFRNRGLGLLSLRSLLPIRVSSFPFAVYAITMDSLARLPFVSKEDYNLLPHHSSTSTYSSIASYYCFLLVRWLSTYLWLVTDDNQYWVIGAELIALLYLSLTVPLLIRTPSWRQPYNDDNNMSSTTGRCTCRMFHAMGLSIELVSNNLPFVLTLFIVQGIVPFTMLTRVWGLHTSPLSLWVLLTGLHFLQSITFDQLIQDKNQDTLPRFTHTVASPVMLVV